MSSRRLEFAAALASALCVSSGVAEDWPQWRGPRHDAASTETGIPTAWDKEKNVAWRLPLPGPAGATPVVWGNNVFLTSADGDQLVLMCVGTDGKERWRQVLAEGNSAARGDEGNSASPSPCTDGEHVWAFMGTGDLGCFTVDGKQVWRANLQDRFGKFDIQFGMSSSPVLYKGLLLLQLIHGDMRNDDAGEPAVVAALDAATGATVWETPRKTAALAESRHSYASPVIYDYGGLTLLITHGGDYTVAYEPTTGKEVWRVGSYNPVDSPKFDRFWRFVASPGIGPGIVVCPTAKRGPVFAVRPDVKGHVEPDDESILWTLEKGTPDVPTPLVHDGLVYLCSEVGILQCLDAKTGEVFYEEPTHGRRRVRASPVYADGHIYVTARDDGRVTVVKAGKTFEIVAQNDTGEAQAATPVVSGGTIYLRTFDALWAVRNP